MQSLTKSKLTLAVWDFLLWSCIIFPLFCGGFWINKPGLKFELTQLAVPTLILSLYAWVLSYKNISVTDTVGVRFFNWLYSAWCRAIDRSTRKTLFVGVLIAGLVFATSSLRRHWSFQSGAADLGIFTSALWNLTHGNGYLSSLKDGINLFADHQSPIFYLFAPIFWLFPHAETLLILQGFIVASGAIALYGLAKLYLGPKHWVLPALPLMYWAYQPLRNANAFDFHPEICLLPAFLYFLWFSQSLEKSKQRISWLFLVLALCTKESAGPVAVGIGFSFLLGAAPLQSRLRMKYMALPVICLGLVAFIFDVKIVPTFFANHYGYMNSYSHLGDGITGILLSPFTRPQIFWEHALFEKMRLKFLFESLAPFAFFPLAAPLQFLAAVPGFLMLFLEGDSHRITTGYHYISEPGVGIFWALAAVFIRFPNPSSRVIKFIPFSVAVYVLFFSFLMHGRSESFRIRFFTPTSYQNWLRASVLPHVDPSATISASGALVPHLATRFWAHHLPKTHRPSGEALDCVIREESVNNWPLQQDEIAPLETELKKDFILEYRCRSFSVYRFQTRQDRCLPNPPICP